MSTCTRHRELVFNSNTQLGGCFTEGECRLPQPTTEATLLTSNTLPLMKHESLHNNDDCVIMHTVYLQLTNRLFWCTGLKNKAMWVI